jgi:hypothetical protein
MKSAMSQFVISFFFVLTASTNVAGQGKWGIDCRPSLNFPTRLFSGIKLEPGFGFDIGVTYNVVANASVYGGWGWSMFPQNKTNGNTMSVEKMGSNFGLKYTQPLNSFNLACFVKGGAAYQHLRVEKAVEKRYRSGHEWGWQIESGLSMPLDANIALELGLKYTNLSGIIHQDGSDNTFHLNDLSAGITLSIKFGK